MTKTKPQLEVKPQAPYYYTKLQDDWLPIPEPVLQYLGWTEGTEVEIVTITGDQIVIRRKGATSDAT